MRFRSASLPVVAAVGLGLLLSGCDAQVRGDAPARGGSDIDIRTPLGTLTARTDTGAASTGLPLYAGARPLSERNNESNATVTIDTSIFGLEVAAGKFESADAPEAILAFYRTAMQTYGPVVECRGDFDFRGNAGARQPFCKESASSATRQLAVGAEERLRVVSVKPRGNGSEFALVFTRVREGR